MHYIALFIRFSLMNVVNYLATSVIKQLKSLAKPTEIKLLTKIVY